MSAEAAAITPETATEQARPPARPRSIRRVAILAAAVLVPLGAAAGLWTSGVLPGWLGQRSADQAAPPAPPVLIELPEIVTNLNVQGRRPTFLKLRAKIEVGRADAPAVQAALPRIVDLFQTLLRELRPEELRGSAGTHRLKEELVARANIAVAPARVADVLFVEMLVQ